jgi:hypothetical protein
MNALIRTKTPHSAAAPRQLNETASKQAVEIEHLRKTYGTLVAVDDVSFSVAEGEIFGILGPNGAGKTTTVECAIGLRTPDSGTIRLMGLDPQADRDKVREIVGVQLQESSFPAKLRVGEILDMYQSFYREPADVTELIEVLGLETKRMDYYRSLSGGPSVYHTGTAVLGAGRADGRPGVPDDDQRRPPHRRKRRVLRCECPEEPSRDGARDCAHHRRDVRDRAVHRGRCSHGGHHPSRAESAPVLVASA